MDGEALTLDALVTGPTTTDGEFPVLGGALRAACVAAEQSYVIGGTDQTLVRVAQARTDVQEIAPRLLHLRLAFVYAPVVRERTLAGVDDRLALGRQVLTTVLNRWRLDPRVMYATLSGPAGPVGDRTRSLLLGSTLPTFAPTPFD